VSATPLAAVIQMSSGAETEANWRQARELVTEAASRGAGLVATPENTPFLGPHEQKVRRAEPLDGPTCRRFAGLAGELGIHLLLGSFAERNSSDSGRCYNTSVLFGPGGKRLAAYRKIHLFDVDLPPDVCFQESATVAPGKDLAVAPTPLGMLGLSVCYDLRFPELFRSLVAMGAELLAVPSAFTYTTGKAHWETLLRARAIENQCWVLAPGQWGRHDDDGLRHSWGHSMIVDPWGEVVAVAPEGPGLALAEIDLQRLRRVRRQLPALEHRRLGG
jgi:deaminated glutathione amidase